VLSRIKFGGIRTASQARELAVHNLNKKENHLMKKFVSTLACCALIAPLAFGKDSRRTKPWHFAFVAERPVTVTASSIAPKTSAGAAAAYQPAGILLVEQDGPGRYVLDEPGHVFNRKGEPVHTVIRPGTRLHVYFTNEGGVQTIDRVVID
jgi:hypothetical protein